VSGQLHSQAALPPGKEPSLLIGYETGWAPESVWMTWRGEKSYPYRDSKSYPSAVQPAASSCNTDCDIQDYKFPSVRCINNVCDFGKGVLMHSNKSYTHILLHVYGLILWTSAIGAKPVENVMTPYLPGISTSQFIFGCLSSLQLVALRPQGRSLELSFSFR
jgi:hypothetical protein